MVPRFAEMMSPFLEAVSDGAEHDWSELREAVATSMNLSAGTLSELTGSGRENRFRMRLNWAGVYLGKAGLVKRPRRGVFVITERGRKVLADRPADMVDYMMRYPEFREFHRPPKSGEGHDERAPASGAGSHETLTPDDMLDDACRAFDQAVRAELLERLKAVDPVRFERVILNLLEKMGYGTGHETKLSHDGGIDGIIDEDELGLSRIYMQAKRYSEGRVNGREMRDFIGALGVMPVIKGVFVTTSEFSEDARKIAGSAQGKTIVLIDGEKLVSLMIRHRVGARVKQTIDIMKIDEDYFSDEE